MSADLQQLFADIVRAQIRLYNALDQRLRPDDGLAANQYAVLRFIEMTEACRVGDIARGLVITVGAASKSVDRLESAGWVVRLPNPRNRRSSLLGLTEPGRILLAAASRTVDAELHRLLDAALPEAQLAQLATTMTRVLSTLESAGAGQPTG